MNMSMLYYFDEENLFFFFSFLRQFQMIRNQTNVLFCDLFGLKLFWRCKAYLFSDYIIFVENVLTLLPLGISTGMLHFSTMWEGSPDIAHLQLKTTTNHPTNQPTSKIKNLKENNSWSHLLWLFMFKRNMEENWQ